MMLIELDLLLKILLLTDVPPSKEFSGSLFTDKLCGFIPKGSLAAFIVINPALKNTKVSPEAEWIPMEFAWKPNDAGIMTGIKRFGFPFSMISSAFTFIKETYNAVFKIKPITKKIIKFAEKHEVDRIWCIIQGQSLIRIADIILKKSNIPLHTQIWDPPDWWLRANHIDRFTSASVLKKYVSVLKRSRKVAAISSIMQKDYIEEYAADAIAVTPGLDKNDAFPPASACLEENKLTIGIAGQIYAMENWNALIQALDKADWQIAGKDVSLRILGYGMPQLGGHQKRNIEFLGYRSQNETTSILSKTDILYLPYWFDKTFEKEARQCFPSKLTSYFLAGRPVFCHAPDYSSPYKFLTEHGAGLCCDSLDEGKILESLTRLATDNELYKRTAENGHDVFISLLSYEPLLQSFAKFLDVRAEELISR